MKTIAVIPARIGSTRFPKKPLALIAGKPLLQWVIEGSLTSQKIQKLFVATDDESIAQLARKCGVEPLMTDPNIATGTDRIYQATQKLDFDLVLNIQGDEPLIQGHILDTLIHGMESDSNCNMGTLAHSFSSDEDVQNPNMVKVLTNHKSEAIYFSRFPVPFSRIDIQPDKSLFHIGIYAYKKNFLEKFCQQSPTLLEEAESLEQLRALYLGAKIKVVKVNYQTHGVDVPGDVQKIESILKQRGHNL